MIKYIHVVRRNMKHAFMQIAGERFLLKSIRMKFFVTNVMSIGIFENLIIIVPVVQLLKQMKFVQH